MSMLASLFKTLLKIPYPAFCRGCELYCPDDAIFCATCDQHLRALVSVHLSLGKNMVMPVYSAGAYDFPLKNLITAKFRGDLLASRQLAKLVISRAPAHVFECDYIVPVPLHWMRYATRGFNQAHELAKALSRITKIPVLTVIARRRSTAFQSKLSAALRQNNVKDAFGVAWRYQLGGMPQLEGKRILLVDDLCTTGSTLMSVGKELKKFKPAQISAVVGARAVY
jgi:ComF family protein